MRIGRGIASLLTLSTRAIRVPTTQMSGPPSSTTSIPSTRCSTRRSRSNSGARRWRSRTASTTPPSSPAPRARWRASSSTRPTSPVRATRPRSASGGESLSAEEKKGTRALRQDVRALLHHGGRRGEGAAHGVHRGRGLARGGAQQDEARRDARRRVRRGSSVGLRTKMRTAGDEATRKACWEGLRAIGPFVTSNGFVELVQKRNQMARALGYVDFYDYKVTQAEGFGKAALFEILDTLEVGTRRSSRRRASASARSSAPSALEPWNTGHAMAGSGVTKKLDPVLPLREERRAVGPLVRRARHFVRRRVDEPRPPRPQGQVLQRLLPLAAAGVGEARRLVAADGHALHLARRPRRHRLRPHRPHDVDARGGPRGALRQHPAAEPALLAGARADVGGVRRAAVDVPRLARRRRGVAVQGAISREGAGDPVVARRGGRPRQATRTRCSRCARCSRCRTSRRRCTRWPTATSPPTRSRSSRTRSSCASRAPRRAAAASQPGARRTSSPTRRAATTTGRAR